MPSGDNALSMTWIGQKFKEEASDLLAHFSENDKHLMSSILKDTTKVQVMLLSHGEEAYFREMGHIKAQFSNLSAKYADEAQKRTFRLIGQVIGQVAAGILDKMI